MEKEMLKEYYNKNDFFFLKINVSYEVESVSASEKYLILLLHEHL